MDYEGFEAGSPVTNQSFRAAPWIAPTEGVGYTCVFTVPFLSKGEGRGESQSALWGCMARVCPQETQGVIWLDTWALGATPAQPMPPGQLRH